MSVSRHHADWLSLVEVSGPFVSLPVLLRVFPQGLEPRDPAQAKALRTTYEEWQDNPAASGKQRAWIMHVLTAALSYPPDQIVEGQKLPAGLEANMPEMAETLRPDFALVGPAGSDTAGKAQLLITSYPAEQTLDKPVIGKYWKATPATRMMELLHGAGVPLGLVTNGEHWMLVYAPRGETSGYASWYGALWLDEPITLRALHSLLGVRRFFGVAADATLLALLQDSAGDQQEVTDQLGYQVREAVEVLVQSFDSLDKESNRSLLKGVSDTSLYEAALTVMMRLVFLFSAEERGLLHLGEPLYDDNYAVSTLQEQLQEMADHDGEEVLERRCDSWARLLATFRAVHGGIHHQDLLIQAYGGSLFNPDRYPFLEGRPADSSWLRTPAEPLAVNNRVVLHLLNSLQRLRTKIGTGGTTETRRISFRALGVEQIGHVYEGLLDHTAVRAKEPVLGIKGTHKKEAEIPLAALESLLAQGKEKLLEYLKEETGRSIAALRHAQEEGNPLDEHKLLIACDQDEALLARLRPFAGLIREDSFERPLVVLADSIYVTAGTMRRSTGTHYTPPSLTEPIVQHTLEPLVYEGPAEGWPREKWKLNSPKSILTLKICDMAMGSGAFLVQACRYLAERLVEAWENEEKRHPGKVLITPDGKFSEGVPSERLVPADANERIAIARRVIADRCLYGVDINSMAVEMAKLSLWLITVDANRPFTFLDHAFKCGDSLLGANSVKQIEYFSLRSGERQITFAAANLSHNIEEASTKRRALEDLPSNDNIQIATKNLLYVEAESSTNKVRAVANALIALELRGLDGAAYDRAREIEAEKLQDLMGPDMVLEQLTAYGAECLAKRHPFHWPIEFPEVFVGGGFDAIVGNPPFIGGHDISGLFGADYRAWLAKHLFGKKAGLADICAFFVTRGYSLLKNKAAIGLIATNSITEGDSKRVGLDQLISSGAKIIQAWPDMPWPGNAAVVISPFIAFRGDWNADTFSPTLTRGTQLEPFALAENEEMSFVGCYLLGKWFELAEADAHRLFAQDPQAHELILPYINGVELNAFPDLHPRRWAICFWDWSESAARCHKSIFDFLEHAYTNTDRTEDGGAERPSWWLFARSRPALYHAVGLGHLFKKHPSGWQPNQEWPTHAIVKAKTSETWAFAFLPATTIFDQALTVFPSSDRGLFSVLQSTLHEIWARGSGAGSKMKTDLRYAPTTFEAFPRPGPSADMERIALAYESHRTQIMLRRAEGLTDIYNRFHLRDEKAPDIERLRTLHAEMDQIVTTAYGWSDLNLDHGFHETKQGVRYTISEYARRTVLDRLLALNHQRHAEEEASRVPDAVAPPVKRGRKKKDSDDQIAMDL